MIPPTAPLKPSIISLSIGSAHRFSEATKKNPMINSQRGFTLTELLVVITIISLLVAMLLPTIKMVRQAAYGVGCLSNQRQMYLSIQAYTQDWKILPPTSSDGNFPGWPHATAARYLESTLGKSDGNAPYDVLKCPGDRRSVAGGDDAISHHSQTVDKWMQCMWCGDFASGSTLTRVWSSYASNCVIFNGKSRLMPEIALFWDSWTFTSQQKPNPTGGFVSTSVPGVSRHGRGTNVLYGDGHAAHIESAYMLAGRPWEIVDWAGSSAWYSDLIQFVGPAFPAEYANSDLPPWRPN